MRCRSEATKSTRCGRKKPRDALSVRTTGKGLAQIVTTEMIATTGSRWGTREKSRASAKGASVGRVYREVSFNELGMVSP